MVKTRSQIKKIVGRYVQELGVRGISVERVILFGSYAYHRAREGSDIDLAIVSPQFALMGLRKRYQTLGLANMTLQSPIQAMGYSPQEWRNADRGSFIDEIQRTGRVLYRNGNTRKKVHRSN